MSIELKIKSKHLGVEAQIIRQEERKLKSHGKWLREHQKSDDATMSAFHSLNQHRRWDVRNENRATFLARAFLAGKKYTEVETKVVDKGKLMYYIVPRVLKMVNKYGTKTVTSTDLINWIDGKSG